MLSGTSVLIPYFLRKDSPFVRFHANQGLLLLIMEILIPIAAGFVLFFGWAVNLAAGSSPGLLLQGHQQRHQRPFR
jgi:uncharacterized membrane protein